MTLYVLWLTFSTLLGCDLLAPLSKAIFVQIDATEEQALRGRFFVNAFPQLSLLRDKETRIYTGPRSLEGVRASLDNTLKNGTCKLTLGTCNKAKSANLIVERYSKLTYKWHGVLFMTTSCWWSNTIQQGTDFVHSDHIYSSYCLQLYLELQTLRTYAPPESSSWKGHSWCHINCHLTSQVFTRSQALTSIVTGNVNNHTVELEKYDA